MAITPYKTKIEQAGLEYIEPHEIVKDTGPKALNLLAQAVVDIQAKPAPTPGDIPIFASLAEAEAYEAANPGKTALTIENQTGPITPAAPSFDDEANTYTIPAATGVGYKVGGSVVEPGTYPVGNIDTTVMISAYATSERGITGTAEWVGVFKRTSKIRTLLSETFTHPDGTAINGLPVEGASGLKWTANLAEAVVTGGRALGAYDQYKNNVTKYTVSFEEPGIRQLEVEWDYQVGSTDCKFSYIARGSGAGNSQMTHTLPYSDPDFPKTGRAKLVATANASTLYVDGVEKATLAHEWVLDPAQTLQWASGRGSNWIDNIVVRVGS